MTPLDHAVSYNNNTIISLLLRGGASTEKSVGAVYYANHYTNSILFSLWCNGDVENVSVLIDAGYRLNGSHIRNMFKVARICDWEVSVLNAIERLLHEPMSLKRTCRMVIRRQLMAVKCKRRKSLQLLIPELPLPGALRKFISMF